MTYRYHLERQVHVAATPDTLFAELDDHDRLASHMTRSSMFMAGSSMVFDYDETHGRAIGSRIRMRGTMLGLRLELEEVVTERSPPNRKAWETIGEPRLFAIGPYRMGFVIEPDGKESRLTVSIDYDDAPPPWRWLSRMIGRFYARWCTESMAKGAAASFA